MELQPDAVIDGLIVHHECVERGDEGGVVGVAPPRALHVGRAHDASHRALEKRNAPWNVSGAEDADAAGPARDSHRVHISSLGFDPLEELGAAPQPLLLLHGGHVPHL